MNFFAIFLEFSLTRQFGTKQNDNFSFLSPKLFHPILAWNEATIVFLIFLNFLLFFWNFLLPVWSEGNGKTIFIFSLSRHFPTYFGMKRSQNGIFFIFLLFFSFFGILYFPSCRSGTERQFLFSLFLLLFQPILAWKEAVMGFFFFLIISYASGRNETKR